jgi:hypothetical protein
MLEARGVKEADICSVMAKLLPYFEQHIRRLLHYIAGLLFFCSSTAFLIKSMMALANVALIEGLNNILAELTQQFFWNAYNG